MLIKVSPYPDIAQAKQAAEDAIDQAIGQERLRYLTEVPGQQASYDAKHLNAIAWLKHFQDNGEAPTPGVFPWVAREAFYTSQSEYDTAMTIATTGGLWDKQLGPELEGIRVGLKGAVRAAETEREVITQRNEALAIIPGVLD